MRKVLTRSGAWVEPMLRGDRSRLLCHLQEYLEETAERLVHGLTQAFMKRGLPLSLSCAGCRAQVVNCGLRQWQDLPHRRLYPDGAAWLAPGPTSDMCVRTRYCPRFSLGRRLGAPLSQPSCSACDRRLTLFVLLERQSHVQDQLRK